MDKPAAAADRHRSGSVSRRWAGQGAAARPCGVDHQHRAGQSRDRPPQRLGLAWARVARFSGCRRWVGAALDQDRSRLVVLGPSISGPGLRNGR